MGMCVCICFYVYVCMCLCVYVFFVDVYVFFKCLRCLYSNNIAAVCFFVFGKSYSSSSVCVSSSHHQAIGLST